MILIAFLEIYVETYNLVVRIYDSVFELHV